MYIDGKEITISKSVGEISLKIEDSLDIITINMTKEEAIRFIKTLQLVV